MKIERKYFCKYFTVRLIILNRFQHPFQEGLLEKVLLKMILYVFSVFEFETNVKKCFYLELRKFYPCNFAREQGEGA